MVNAHPRLEAYLTLAACLLVFNDQLKILNRLKIDRLFWHHLVQHI